MPSFCGTCKANYRKNKGTEKPGFWKDNVVRGWDLPPTASVHSKAHSDSEGGRI